MSCHLSTKWECRPRKCSTYIYSDHISGPEHSQDTHTVEQKPSSHEKKNHFITVLDPEVYLYWESHTRTVYPTLLQTDIKPRFNIIMQNIFSLVWVNRGGVPGTLYLPLDVSGTDQYTRMMGDYLAMSKMPLAGGVFSTCCPPDCLS